MSESDDRIEKPARQLNVKKVRLTAIFLIIISSLVTVSIGADVGLWAPEDSNWPPARCKGVEANSSIGHECSEATTIIFISGFIMKAFIQACFFLLVLPVWLISIASLLYTYLKVKVSLFIRVADWYHR